MARTKAQQEAVDRRMGTKVGLLTLVRQVEAPEHIFKQAERNAAWVYCECECGGNVVTRIKTLSPNAKAGQIRSCGCLRRKQEDDWGRRKFNRHPKEEA